MFIIEIRESNICIFIKTDWTCEEIKRNKIMANKALFTYNLFYFV